MENCNHAPAFMGFDRKKLDSLNREYTRLNPHNLPELRRRQRTRFSRGIGEPEKVFSTRKAD